MHSFFKWEKRKMGDVISKGDRPTNGCGGIFFNRNGVWRAIFHGNQSVGCIVFFVTNVLTLDLDTFWIFLSHIYGSSSLVLTNPKTPRMWILSLFHDTVNAFGFLRLHARVSRQICNICWWMQFLCCFAGENLFGMNQKHSKPIALQEYPLVN